MIRNGNLNTPGFVSDGETWHEVINRNLGLDTPRKVYIKESEYILTTVDQELILAAISHYTTGMRTRTWLSDDGRNMHHHTTTTIIISIGTILALISIIAIQIPRSIQLHHDSIILIIGIVTGLSSILIFLIALTIYGFGL